MTPSNAFIALALLLGSALGCNLASASGDEDKSTPPSPHEGGGISSDRPPSPAGRSAVPTLSEWNGVGEVTVRGSSALGCSTKMVREWLRVSCSGKNDSGGTPTQVVVTRGANPSEVFTLASGGLTSLVMPFVEGVDLEATFSWTDKRSSFKARWSRGAPKPGVIGEFVGDASGAARWSVAGGGSKLGSLTLRCEAPEAPSSVASGCMCGSTILNPCAGEQRPRHDVDRRQCSFDCNVEASANRERVVRLQCPDGATPRASARGCECGSQVLDPCGGTASKLASARVSANVCVATCQP